MSINNDKGKVNSTDKNVDSRVKDTSKHHLRLYFGFKTRVFFLVGLIIIFFSIGCILMAEVVQLNSDDVVSYDETSKFDYKVCLNENDIYSDTCLKSGMTYNSSMVNNILVNYKYNVNFSLDVDYNLYYHVVLYNRIYDGNNKKKLLYENDQVLVEKTMIDRNYSKIDFTTNFNIDYLKYSNFVSEYKSKYSTYSNALIEVVVYLDEIDGEREIGKIEIPVGVDTFEINYKNVSKMKQKVKVEYPEWNSDSYTYLLFGSLMIIFSLVFDIRLVRLVKTTFTKRRNYEKELSKILKEYDKKIVNVKDGYQYNRRKKILKVESFGELVDASEIICRPIIYSKINNIKSEFIVEDDDKLYKYVIKDNDD